MKREFPPGAAEWPEGLDRRRFLELAGATLALAGLEGCGPPAKQAFAPFVQAPGREEAEGALLFATAFPREGYARGIVVKSVSGRPVKIEGNPAHPDSLGATDAATQASVLSLYDPDRSRFPRRLGQPAAWTEFEDEWLGRAAGRGFALLTEPTTSPTLLREIKGLLRRQPGSRWYQHTALPRRDPGGVQPDYDFAAADVILSIGADFLDGHPAAPRYIRAFAARRRSEGGAARLNRHYAIEATPSLTGASADRRLAVSPHRLAALLDALAAAIAGSPAPAGLAGAERDFAAALARDWRKAGPRVLCAVGPEEEPATHAWAAELNARCGAEGATLRYLAAVRSDADPDSAGGLAELCASIDRGEIESLAILGCNPAHTAPAELRAAERLRRAPWSVHLGLHCDETAELCRWHLPEAHFLESWSDLRAYGGAATILQPLIEPLYDGRGAAELVRLLSGSPALRARELVRETWLGATGGDRFEERWERWLQAGLVEGDGGRSPGVPRFPRKSPSPPPAEGEVTVLFRADPHLADGRWANNAWLQELPQPLTHLVWGGAAWISPALAGSLGLANGDVVALDAGGAELEAPVWIVPGQAPDCVTVHLGGGRRRSGATGDGVGFDAYRLRREGAPWRAAARIRRTGSRRELVCLHGHFSLEGRDLARTASLAELAAARPAPELPSLYPARPRAGYAWGMSIDLSACIGCQACVAACQAENNIPVVGAEQAALGREMHWLRVDLYLEGDPDNPRRLHQPVPCMQCEDAPCELVCPVGATVHSSEGLNDMVYNRCVGTRYCSNNCPYKVRRFNFLDFRRPAGSPLHLQENPDVSVRSRGVMEKCTYCVQRIDRARIAAEKEGRRVADGEVRTACQQACPAEAIVFGDISDPASRVARRKAEPGSYALLGELGTRPRTTYLPRLVSES